MEENNIKGPIDERRHLIRRAVNQKVLVPDLLALMPAWEKEVHPEVDEVNLEIDKWLKTIDIEEEKKRKQREKSDYALMVATFYPHCSKEHLLLVAKYYYWAFFFDDEVDTGGDLTDDKEGTLECCRQIVKCINDCLGPSHNYEPPPGCPEIVRMLYPILEEFATHMGPESNERHHREIIDYVNGVAREQQVRQGANLPDPWYHFKIRGDDIGALPAITQNEYAMNFEIPDWVRYHEAMETIVHGCMKLILLINEIHSAQKEFRVGQLENICFLFMNTEGIELPQAVDKVLGLIRESYFECVEAEARLPWGHSEKLG